MVDEEVYVSLPTVYRILRAAKLTESAFLQLEAGNWECTFLRRPCYSSSWSSPHNLTADRYH